MSLKLFDMFSGFGGFTIAADKFNIKTIGFSEINKYASDVLRYRYPKIKNYGDINNIITKDLPDFDILTGGWPCQNHSIAGNRKGLSGNRSGLFFTLSEVIQAKLPSMFILENVKGALSSTKGFDFLTVLNELAKTGYDIQWGVVNAKFWVPQNRERVFIVGCLGGFGGREIFPIEPENTKIATLGKDIAFCIDSNYHKGPGNYDKGRRQLVKKINRIGTLDMKGHDYIKRVYGTDGIPPTLPTKTGGGHIPKIVALTETRTEEAKEIRKQVRKEEGKDFSPRRGKTLVPRKDDIGNCLTTSQTKEHLITDFTKIRRLTPIECERLMGLTDNWTKYGIKDETEDVYEISDTQRYRLLGNGIVPAVVEEILRRLLF